VNEKTEQGRGRVRVRVDGPPASRQAPAFAETEARIRRAKLLVVTSVEGLVMGSVGVRSARQARCPVTVGRTEPAIPKPAAEAEADWTRWRWARRRAKT
jgi:hypothetical protein